MRIIPRGGPLGSSGGGGVTDHGALTGLGDDDHTQYQLRSEKAAASGYASLDGSTKVPIAQIPVTSIDHNSLTNLTVGDVHTQYQKESEKDIASGYAGLDVNVRVPTARLGSGVADTTTFLRGDQSWQVPPVGSGSFSISTVEVDLGAIPRNAGSFTITDAGIAGTEQVIVNQAGGPYTGKGDRSDEAEMDGLTCMATAAAGSCTVYWTTPSFVAGNFKFNYLVE